MIFVHVQGLAARACLHSWFKSLTILLGKIRKGLVKSGVCWTKSSEWVLPRGHELLCLVNDKLFSMNCIHRDVQPAEQLFIAWIFQPRGSFNQNLMYVPQFLCNKTFKECYPDSLPSLLSLMPGPDPLQVIWFVPCLKSLATCLL